MLDMQHILYDYVICEILLITLVILQEVINGYALH
jgi:hypothetical protein